MNTRALGIGLTAVAAVAGLSACTKPTPEVTIWSGTSSVISPALCWEPESSVRDAVVSCIADGLSNPTPELDELAVSPGNVVGINVDPEIAEAGWVPTIGEQPLTANPITETYYRFTFPTVEVPDNGYTLTVVARGNAADKDRGLWAFRLVAPTSE